MSFMTIFLEIRVAQRTSFELSRTMKFEASIWPLKQTMTAAIMFNEGAASANMLQQFSRNTTIKTVSPLCCPVSRMLQANKSCFSHVKILFTVGRQTET